MRVGYLTVVFDDQVSDKAAHHLVNEIADVVLSFPAVDACKCDVGNLDGNQEIEFWGEDGRP